jgi:hypothetical protein
VFDLSHIIRKSADHTKRLMRRLIAPSKLMAEISKVIPISDRWYLTFRYLVTFGRTLNLDGKAAVAQAVRPA